MVLDQNNVYFATHFVTNFLEQDIELLPSSPGAIVILVLVSLISLFGIISAISGYRQLRCSIKENSRSKEKDSEKGILEQIVFIERIIEKKPMAVVVLVIVLIILLSIWCMSYSTATSYQKGLTAWLWRLLAWQIGSAALLLSLSIVVIKLSSTVFSMRVLHTLFSPDSKRKQLILNGVFVYILAIFEILILLWGLDFLMTKTAHPASAIVLVVLLLFIHNAAAFLVLIFGLGYVFTITESRNIIETSLRPLLNEQQDTSNSNTAEEDSPSCTKKEDGLQLAFNVINSSIQQSDALSSENGITSVSIMMATLRDNPKLFGKCTTNMMNSAKRALLLGDEATAIYIIKCIIKAVEGSSMIDQSNGPHPLTKKTIQLYLKIISSYSSLSQFSIERGYIESTLSSVHSLTVYNKVLLDYCISESFKSGNLPRDVSPGNPGKEDLNIYDLSLRCIKSASIVSQIAAQKNYETFAVSVSTEISKMRNKLVEFLKKAPGSSESTEEALSEQTQEPVELPVGLIEHYIWSIKDAGVSAAENGLEKAAIDSIFYLMDFGQNLSKLTKQYHGTNIQRLAKLIAHTSAAIREIGQKLAERKLQQGTIRAILAIAELAKLVASSDMIWTSKDHTEDALPEPVPNGGMMETPEDNTKGPSEKLAFVRITWNLKDVGRSAAEHGIEKAIVRAIEVLFDLLRVSLNPNTNWNDEAKKNRVLLRIGEGFYEIAMKTKNQNLQEALTKIIYFDVCCIGCLGATATCQIDDDYKLVRDIFLKTFVDLKPVDNFSKETIQSFLKSKRFNPKSSFYGKYSDFVSPVSEMVSKYASGTLIATSD